MAAINWTSAKITEFIQELSEQTLILRKRNAVVDLMLIYFASLRELYLLWVCHLETWEDDGGGGQKSKVK